MKSQESKNKPMKKNNIAVRAIEVLKEEGLSAFFNNAYTFLINKRRKGIRLKQMLSHPDIKGYPRVNMVLNKDVSPTPQDRLITMRLIEAYKKALIDEAKVLQIPKADIWDSLKQGPHADFVHLLQEENIDTLAYYLCNMARMGVSEGLEQGENEHRKIISSGKYRRWLSLFNADKLICLAEALGVLPCENPEQGRFGWNIYCDIDEIVEKTERYLQIKISPPPPPILKEAYTSYVQRKDQ